MYDSELDSIDDLALYRFLGVMPTAATDRLILLPSSDPNRCIGG